jgi:hypothetical protein
MTFKQNGCASIQAREFGASYLGAVKTESVASPRGVLSQTAASYWLANGQKIGMDQSFSLVMYGESGTISVGDTHGDFSLDGDALVGKITQKASQMNMAGKQIGEVSVESDCRLIRQ